jgi:hypothetical protein
MNCTICDPVKILILILNFQLPGKEHLLSILTKESTQVIARLNLRFI